jgi:hypothetical protein
MSIDLKRIGRGVTSVAGGIAASVVLMAGQALAPGQEAEASPYWRCPAGWTFRVNSAGTGAQCHRQVSDEVAPIDCPNINFLGRDVGTFPHARRGRDKCVGTVTVAGVNNRTEHDPGPCPAGFEYRVDHTRNGDRCVKPGGIEHRAPSSRFESTP